MQMFEMVKSDFGLERVLYEDDFGLLGYRILTGSTVSLIGVKKNQNDNLTSFSISQAILSPFRLLRLLKWAPDEQGGDYMMTALCDLCVVKCKNSSFNLIFLSSKSEAVSVFNLTPEIFHALAKIWSRDYAEVGGILNNSLDVQGGEILIKGMATCANNPFVVDSSDLAVGLLIENHIHGEIDPGSLTLKLLVSRQIDVFSNQDLGIPPVIDKQLHSLVSNENVSVNDVLGRAAVFFGIEVSMFDRGDIVTAYGCLWARMTPASKTVLAILHEGVDLAWWVGLEYLMGEVSGLSLAEGLSQGWQPDSEEEFLVRRHFAMLEEYRALVGV